MHLRTRCGTQPTPDLSVVDRVWPFADFSGGLPDKFCLVSFAFEEDVIHRFGFFTAGAYAAFFVVGDFTCISLASFSRAPLLPLFGQLGWAHIYFALVRSDS